MEPTEIKFYRDMYKLLSNVEYEQLFVKYAQMNYNKALAKLRIKQDIYDVGHANGNLDAWQDLMHLKASITKIMNNVG